VRSFREVFDPKHLEQQQRSFTQLSTAMRELAGKLNHAVDTSAAAPEPDPATERIEHDLLQMRVLTRDTLVLLERISGQLGRLGAGDRPEMLSEEPRVRAMAFPDPVADLDVAAGSASRMAAATDPSRPLPGYDPLATRPLRERR
jgi:hypothetical protein